MKYKCVFSDLDRTLLEDGSPNISPYTKSVIERLLDSGVDFVPCTGRALKSLPPAIFRIRGIRHAVTSNGVSIDDLQAVRSLETLLVPEDIPGKIISLLEKEDVLYEIFIDGQGYSEKSYIDDPLGFDRTTFNAEYIKRTRIPVDGIRDFALRNRDRIGSFDIITHPEDSRRIFKMLKDRFPEVYMTNSESFLIEISNRDCGKHGGLLRYCRMTGIDIGETVAFGDGNNDIEMLETAGLSVAVANASPECRKVADRITESNSQDGVAREIERIFFS